MKFETFGKFSSNNEVRDGDNFLVVYPDGNVKLCYWSRRGYFSAENNYAIDDYEMDHAVLEDNDSLLVCKVEVDDWVRDT